MKLPDAPFPTPPGMVYRSGRNRGVCPRCDVLIVPTSRVVRLAHSEQPNATPDLRRSADTGKFYLWDHRPISPEPKWFVHERCYVTLYGRPELPPELEAAFAASFSALLDAEAAAPVAVGEHDDALTGADVEAFLVEMDDEGIL